MHNHSFGLDFTETAQSLVRYSTRLPDWVPSQFHFDWLLGGHAVDVAARLRDIRAVVLHNSIV